MTRTIALDDKAHDAALALARGTYQRDVLLGYEAMSGSTLKGKAARYGGRYEASRDALMERLSEAGISTQIVTMRTPGRRKVLVIGSSPDWPTLVGSLHAVAVAAARRVRYVCEVEGIERDERHEQMRAIFDAHQLLATIGEPGEWDGRDDEVVAPG